MDIHRLAKQLRREAKANPKKAATLAGLAAIGVYFWAPLVVGWVAPAKGPALATNSAAIAIAPTTEKREVGSVTPIKETTREDSRTWREMWAAMQRDGRRKSTPPLAARDNPFNPNRSRPATVKPADKTNTIQADTPTAVEEEVDPNVPTPESLGMKLTATMITSSRRLAVINGDVIAEGSAIVVEKAGSVAVAKSSKGSTKEQDGKGSSKSADIGVSPRFQVLKVDADFVLLERFGKLYPLRLDTPRLQEKNTLRVAL